MEAGQKYTDSGQALELVSTQLEFGSAITLVANADGTARVDVSGGGSPHALTDHTDVIIAAGAAGEFLRHNGTNWVNVAGVAAADVNAGIFSGAFTFDSNGQVLTLGDGTNVAVSLVMADPRMTIGYDGVNAFIRGGVTKGLLLQSGGVNTRMTIAAGGLVTVNTQLVIGTDPGTTELLRVGGTMITSGSLSWGGGAAITDSDAVPDATGQTNAHLPFVSAGAWNIRALAAGDVASGTFAVARGGTGINTYATGDLIYSDAANSLAARTVGSAG